jgi:hypothetical protein
MKKLIFACLTGMIFFQSCNKENLIEPEKAYSPERKSITPQNPPQTPPIYFPEQVESID